MDPNLASNEYHQDKRKSAAVAAARASASFPWVAPLATLEALTYFSKGELCPSILYSFLGGNSTLDHMMAF